MLACKLFNVSSLITELRLPNNHLLVDHPHQSGVYMSWRLCGICTSGCISLQFFPITRSAVQHDLTASQREGNIYTVEPFVIYPRSYLHASYILECVLAMVFG